MKRNVHIDIFNPKLGTENAKHGTVDQQIITVLVEEKRGGENLLGFVCMRICLEVEHCNISVVMKPN